MQQAQAAKRTAAAESATSQVELQGQRSAPSTTAEPTSSGSATAESKASAAAASANKGLAAEVSESAATPAAAAAVAAGVKPQHTDATGSEKSAQSQQKAAKPKGSAGELLEHAINLLHLCDTLAAVSLFCF